MLLTSLDTTHIPAEIQVTHMFLIPASTAIITVMCCQITHDTQKLHGHQSTMHPKRTYENKTDSLLQQNFQLPPCSPLPDCWYQWPISSITPPRNRYSSNIPCSTIQYLLVVKQTTRWLNTSKINGVLDGSCNFLFNWMCVRATSAIIPSNTGTEVITVATSLSEDRLQAVCYFCTLWNIWRRWLTSSLGMRYMPCSRHTWQHVAHAWQSSHWHMLLRRDPCQHHSPPAALALQHESH